MKFLEGTMKFYNRLSNLTILIVLFIPNSLTYAITMPLQIHELVDKSDLVVIGTVTRSQVVINDIDSQDIVGPETMLGDIFAIQIDKVLYGKEEFLQEIFFEGRIGNINRNLKRSRKRKPVNLFAYRSGQTRHTEGAVYFENKSQLFFLAVSKFPATLPDTTIILDEDWSPNGSQSQILTKSDLTEKFYFEASFPDRQSTWLLSRKKQKRMRPTVETFCEVMSIPNLAQREQKLRGLLNHDDVLLASNAEAALREIENDRDAK
jgi:hypothetical protein